MNEAPPRAPLALRLAGGVVLLGLIGLLMLWNMAVLVFPSGPLSWLPETLLVITLLFCVFAAWKKIRVLESAVPVGAGAAVLLAGVVYLAWDDATIEHPLTLQELAPQPARDAEAGYTATLAFTKTESNPAPRTQPNPKHYLKNSPVEKPAEWAKEVAANREKVAANFAVAAPAQEWLAELDRFDEIGDMPKADWVPPYINSTVFRQAGSALCDEAAALAQEGRGDEAMELLRLLASVSAKLERHARTDVRLMTGATGLRRAIAAADYVLATATVSPEKKAALAAALSGRDIAQTRRRLAWLNYVIYTEMVLQYPDTVLTAMTTPLGRDQFLIKLFGWTRPLTVLPRNTTNLLAEYSREIERLLKNPQSENIASDGGLLYRRVYSASPKNFGGRALIMIAVPNYRKVAEALQTGEQARLALLAKLRA